MEIDTLRAARSFGFYPPPARRTERRTSLKSLSSPQLIIDSHFASQRLYSRSPPALPQRSARRSLYVQPEEEEQQAADSAKLHEAELLEVKSLPSATLSTHLPPDDSRASGESEEVPQIAEELDLRHSRLEEVEQAKDEESKPYCDCSHAQAIDQPLQRLISAATYAVPEKTSQPAKSADDQYQRGRHHSPSNRNHSATDSRSLRSNSSSISHYGARTSRSSSENRVADSSLTTPMSESFHKDYCASVAHQSEINLEEDQSPVKCIPMASRDEIAELLKRKEDEAQALAARGGQSQSLLSKPFSSLKRAARRLGSTNEPIKPFTNPAELAKLYPSLTTKELMFLGNTPTALAQLQSPKTHIKPVTNLKAENKRAPWPTFLKTQLQQPRTLEDVLDTLTPGEKDFLRNRPDAAKLLPSSANNRSSSMPPRARRRDPQMPVTTPLPPAAQTVMSPTPATVRDYARIVRSADISTTTRDYARIVRDNDISLEAAPITDSNVISQEENPPVFSIRRRPVPNERRSSKRFSRSSTLGSVAVAASPVVPSSRPPMPRSQSSPLVTNVFDAAATTEPSGSTRLRRIASRLSIETKSSAKHRGNVDSTIPPVPRVDPNSATIRQGASLALEAPSRPHEIQSPSVAPVQSHSNPPSTQTKSRPQFPPQPTTTPPSIKLRSILIKPRPNIPSTLSHYHQTQPYNPTPLQHPTQPPPNLKPHPTPAPTHTTSTRKLQKATPPKTKRHSTAPASVRTSGSSGFASFPYAPEREFVVAREKKGDGIEYEVVEGCTLGFEEWR